MPDAIAYPINGSDQQLLANWSGAYRGFSLEETGAAAAKLRIYDGTSTAGILLESVGLGALETAREFYPDGVVVKTGIYIDIVSGTIAGHIRLSG